MDVCLTQFWQIYPFGASNAHFWISTMKATLLRARDRLNPFCQIPLFWPSFGHFVSQHGYCFGVPRAVSAHFAKFNHLGLCLAVLDFTPCARRTLPSRYNLIVIRTQQFGPNHNNPSRLKLKFEQLHIRSTKM